MTKTTILKLLWVRRVIKEMKNYYFKTDRTEYQNKILDTIDKALNDLDKDDFDILIQRIQEYIDDLN